MIMADSAQRSRRHRPIHRMAGPVLAGLAVIVLASACGSPAAPRPAVPQGTERPSAPASTATPVPTAKATVDPAAILAEVARTSPTSAELATLSRRDQVERLLRCFDLAGISYCLGFGFSPVRPEPAVYASIAESYERGEADEPGAESAAGYFKKRLLMSNAERLAAEQDEVGMAIPGIDKMKKIKP